MALSEEEIDRPRDLFAGVGAITARPMIGGVGLSSDGTIFSLTRPDGVLLLKGAGDFRPHLEALGCAQWTFTRKDGATSAMCYWSIPDDLQADPDGAADLARKALAHL